MEMEIIVVAKEENTMPENWRPASEMRKIATDIRNEHLLELVNELMGYILTAAQLGSTSLIKVKPKAACLAEVHERAAQVLIDLGYTVECEIYNNAFYTIKW